MEAEKEKANSPFEKPYDPKISEPKILNLWQEKKLGHPEEDPNFEKAQENFNLVLPPPNVTGILHAGHAAMLSIEDTLVRFARLNGKRVLWLPGTDHAGIATQAKVEEILYKKEGKTKYDLGKEEFLKMVRAFAENSKETILHQIKRLGASLDWSRLSYTLDAPRELAVKTAFKKLYDLGLIYRGKRIVNWDPKLKTTISDDEIEYKEETAPLYYFKYGPFEIATARPETKFGDKYVVVHPEDKRYEKFTHGQKINLPWLNGEITATVIKDELIDPSFGTGAMTITPAHSGVDFEIAQKHKLDYEQIIDFNGLLLPIAGEFAGQHIKKARPLIVEHLKELGLLLRVDEKYTHNLATNSRGGGIIEPQIKEQWFIGVEKEFVLEKSNISTIPSGTTTTLKEIMRRALTDKMIKIHPPRFEKIYLNWIENLQDWCISRQIWYGHKIPVWHKEGKVFCDITPPREDGWQEDPDTLDTWFSSGLWTFSTLGWPEKTDELKKYHPNTIIETGYDILFFWVARMILMSGALLGEIPFRDIYLNGLVRDIQGRKISKSLGNNIDPLEMIEKYGTDALRISLIIGNPPGSDLRLSEDKIRGQKHFANKLWNMARFVSENTPTSPKRKLTEKDQEIWSEFENFCQEIRDDCQSFRLYLAAEKLYHYSWHTFADKLIEEKKVILKDPSLIGTPERESAESLMRFIFLDLLKILHPFVPFVTEAIWQEIKPAGELLARESWPERQKDMS